ncbi:MAG: amino acid adenylation domain-containing protein [Agarilytica sp.]
MQLQTVEKQKNFLDLLLLHFETHPQLEVITYLPDDGSDPQILTYATLITRAKAIAVELKNHCEPGDRALMMFNSGLEFVEAFIACVFAGVIAVPAYPPKRNRNLDRVESIIVDSDAKVLLTSSVIYRVSGEVFTSHELLKTRPCIRVDEIASNLAKDWQQPKVDSNDIIFLQYTSGSTGNPKGVMVSHKNTMSNLSMICHGCGYDETTISCSWLPLFHDMGLIGGLLAPIYLGFPVVVMSPASFLKNPRRWLQVISDYGVTETGGPNFAYELCVNEIPLEKREGIDLSSLRQISTGAEPVNFHTIRRFVNSFKSLGVREDVFTPTYGMAECTVYATGAVRNHFLNVLPEAMEQHKIVPTQNPWNAKTITGNGVPSGDCEIIIVHPETKVCLPEGEVGEIWMCGSHVAQGYWNKIEETKQTFEAYTSDTREGPYLRTGDLGALLDKQLFITGRHKDLIIIRGSNYYPQDFEGLIERIAEYSDAALPPFDPSCAAAFNVNVADEERLILVVELNRHYFRDVKRARDKGVDGSLPPLKVAEEITKVVAEQYELSVDDIVFIKTGTLPKTSSGKVQRRKAKALYLDGALDIVWSKLNKLDTQFDSNNGERDKTQVNPQDNDNSKKRGVQELTEKSELPIWIQRYLSSQLQIDKNAIDSDTNFFQLGVSSVVLMRLTGELEEKLKLNLSNSFLWEYPTLSELVGALEALKASTVSPSQKIQPCEIDTHYKLSSSQKRLWFLDKLEGPSATYNLSETLKLGGPLKIEVLEDSFNKIVSRHASLRTVYKEIEGEPVQTLVSTARFSINEIDLRDKSFDSEKKKFDQVSESVSQFSNLTFDLSSDLMLRAQVILVSDSESYLTITMHHIASDGWSIGVFAQELSHLYRALLNGKLHNLDTLVVQYKDYAGWQNDRLEKGEFSNQLSYWKENLVGLPPLLELPTDKVRPRKQSFSGANIYGNLPKDLVDRLNAVARENSCSLFTLLMTAYQILLFKYSRQNEFAVGTPVANRTHNETENLIGFFVNNLTLRAEVEEAMTCDVLALNVAHTFKDAYQNQDIPFDQVVEAVNPERNLSFSPIFQVGFALQSTALNALELEGLEVEWQPRKANTSKFDLHLACWEDSQGATLDLEYSTDIFEKHTVERMLEHYQRVLEQLAEKFGQKVGEICFTAEAEVNLLLTASEIETKFDKQDTLVSRFFDQAKQSSKDVAIRYCDNEVTYETLDNDSNRLAHHLRKLGVKANSLVGLSVERNENIVLGILAILKAGGAYVPIDPANPRERISFILQDSSIDIVLTERAVIESLSFGETKKLLLDALESEVGQISDEALDSVNTAEDLAYIIYTSGSTGKPKGVQVTHKNVLRLFDATDQWFQFDASDTWALFHSYAFDFSVWEIWGALLNGGRVVVVPKETARSPDEFLKLVIDEKVTVLNQTPSAFYQFIKADESNQASITNLRYVIFGGEALNLQSLMPWVERHGDKSPQLINMYGITETTVHVTYRPITRVDIENNLGSVIGKPIPDLSLYILDDNQNLLPVGIPGEICVGGAGVARGYLNRDELTAERFIDNPFKSGETLYRSGDLARRQKNGDLEYIGRIDNQVKIRGFRIELGEMESAILNQENVRDVVVLVRNSNENEQNVVAYVVPEDKNFHAFGQELRKSLRALLPEHMVPAGIVLVDVMPLTANGKVDRETLLKLEFQRDTLSSEFVAPSSEMEQALADIWKDVIQIKKVGAYDNFFELGGHSLLATQVVSRINEAFSADLQVRLVFEYPILSEFAKQLESLIKTHSEEHQIIEKISERDGLPVSFAQQRLWFLDQLEGPSATYNMSKSLDVKGAIDIKVLNQSFLKLVQRHESLRTVFVEEHNQPIQRILDVTDFDLDVIDLRSYKETDPLKTESHVVEKTQEEASRPFDLTADLMLRGQLLLVEDEHAVLTITMHHIASDGWSLAVFVRELAEEYECIANRSGNTLNALPVHYGEFSSWQRQWMEGERCAAELDYWREELSGLPPLLQLPTDKPRPKVQSFRGKNLLYELPLHLMQDIRALASRYEVSPFMVTVSAYYIMLAKYSGQSDIAIGSPIANRTRKEIENLIGFFVNTLTLRAEVNAEDKVEDFIRQIKQVTLGAYSNQAVPFEYIVDDINPERDLAYSPLFQVVFAFQNVPQEKLGLSGLELIERPRHVSTAKFDLNLAFWETENGAVLDFEYSTDLYEENSIQAMLERYRHVLEQIVENPKQEIGSISFIDEESEKQLVHECAAKSQVDVTQTLVDRFLVNVHSHRDTVALSCGTKNLSYQELNYISNQLAHRLIELGVQRGSLVGLSVERNQNIVVGILAILKAGGAYVPIDPSYPQDRIQYVLEDAAIDVLLTESIVLDQLPKTGVKHVLLDAEPLEAFSRSEPDVPRDINDLAYIIYTSGSTGKPKGVQITHANVVRLFDATNTWFGFDENDTWTLFHSYAFDFSVWEIWGALFYGGRVVVVPKEISRSPEEFHRLLSEEKITVLNQTPSAFYQLIQSDEKYSERKLELRYVIFGGEALNLQALKPWFDRYGDETPKLINMYGITETTVHVTYRVILRRDVENNLGSVIGVPIPDLSLYLMDAKQKLLPVGIPGEMYVGGGGVALGYLNREELTAERFIDNPYSLGEKLYRSGDLARRLVNGDLEYLGRIDSQVKVRGFRIELGEIESEIQKHAQVRDAVVLVREDKSGDKRLVSYVVYKVLTESSKEVDQDQVDDWSDIFQGTYDEITEEQDPRFNFVGWNSSYTNERIPDSEMIFWADETVDRIATLKPKNVLEIGCGTGLMLFRLADHFYSYKGSDFSRGPIEHIRKKLHRLEKKSENVELFHREATDFSNWDGDQFDVVVLNSIAQYFPSVEYLYEVIEKSIQHIKPGGAMFIGDNRNLSLIEHFYDSIEFFSSHSETPTNQVQYGSKQRLLQEKELLLEPEFFLSLKQHIPEIEHVQVMPKLGDYVNELSKFRFDAVLHIRGGENEKAERSFTNTQWMKWSASEEFKSDLETCLLDAGSVVAVSAIPNYRLQNDTHLHQILRDRNPPENAGQIKAQIEKSQPSLPVIREWLELADKYSCVLELSWLNSREGEYHIAFKPQQYAACFIDYPASLNSDDWHSYANNPYHAQVVRTLVPELRKQLKQALPEHMMPSAFVLLEKMPLTPNGKVDRRKLPESELLRLNISEVFIAPRNEHERMLADIWCDVLGMEQVGVKDNFFELGGHSLLATQVMSRIRDAFQVELSVRELFDAPTIETLSARVVNCEADSGQFVLPPIEVAAKPEFTPVSYAQQRLWFLEQFEPGNTAYNMTFAERFHGAVDEVSLRECFLRLAQRHEVFRTQFIEKNGEPYQQVIDLEQWQLPIVDLSEEGGDKQFHSLERVIQEELHNPFDLGAAPLLRTTLVKLSSDTCVFIGNMHHIISDGWSIGVFASEFARIYNALIDNRPNPLAPLKIQYRDFTLWQRSWLKEDELQRQIDFWKSQLNDVPTLVLPTDRPRPKIQSFNGAYYYFKLDKEITEQAKRFCQQHNVSLFMELLAVFELLIHRYSDQTDFCVGTPIANRTHEDLESLIGFFVNTLALRADFSDDPDFITLIERVREATLGAYSHQDLPFERMVDEIDVSRNLSYSPLFQVSFILQNAPPVNFDLNGITTESANLDHSTSKFDLTMEFMADSPELAGRVEYNTDLFDVNSIEVFVERFQRILRQLIKNPSVRSSEVYLHGEGEAKGIVSRGLTDEYSQDQELNINTVFDLCVCDYAEHLAVSEGDSSLTYTELDKAANKLANYLVSLGVKKEDRVGLALTRSSKYITSVFAVLKLGASYVPLDENSPEQRIAYIVKDAALKCVLTTPAFSKKVNIEASSLIDLDLVHEKILEQNEEYYSPECSGETEAYLMYTSGSTGQPKGVQVPHRGIVRLVKHCNYLELDQHVVGLLLAATGFDASTFEIYTCILNGGRICVMPPGLASYQDIAETIAREQVNLALLPTGLFSGLVSESPGYLQGLKQLVVGGDVLTKAVAKKALDHLPDTTLINAYGPTENTVITTTHAVSRESLALSSIPIGKAIQATHVFVLDKNLKPVPENIAGELYTSGLGLAVGYLNSPDQTEESFLENPFSTTEVDKLLYRTGDRAMWSSEGELIFLGRSDQQVKIRGFRIEIGEIESAILAQDNVHNVAVIVQKGANDINQLVAYIHPENSETFDEAELKLSLAQTVPSYMMPAFYPLVDMIPLNKSGKVDKKALPRVDVFNVASEYIAPEGELENKIAAIWAEVLHVDQVGREENFFDLGGHSLLATQAVSRVRDKLETDLSVKDIFESPTIAQLAKKVEENISGNKESKLPPITAYEKPEADLAVPASFAQRRLWFVEQFDQGNVTYNMPMILRLTGKVEPERVKLAILHIVQRHKVLRTQFIEKDGEPYQDVITLDEWSLPLIDISDLAKNKQDEKIKEIVEKDLKTPFDLEQAPLFRTTLIKLASGSFVFVGNMHHIISDGWSMGVFQREFIDLYGAYLQNSEAVLPELAIQYQDFTLWQNAWLSEGGADEQLQYWKSKLDAVSILELQTDKPRPAVQTFNGEFYHFDIPEALVTSIRHQSQEQGVSLFMALLSVFQILMQKCSAQDDFCVGSPIANRNHQGLESLIGFFINTLALRADLSGAPTYTELLARVKETTLAAYDNQDVPFEKVLDELNLSRSVDRAPLFQVMFLLQNLPQLKDELPGFISEALEIEHKVAKFDFTLEFFQGENTLKGRFEYNTDLFSEKTIESFANFYTHLLEQVVANPDLAIDQYALLSQQQVRDLAISTSGTFDVKNTPTCVHQRFEVMANTYPDHTAVGDNAQTLSYLELNEKANRLAHLLREHGVEVGDYVGISIDRSVETILAMLATLKSGATYMPIDSSYPRARIDYMLNDSQPKVLLVSGLEESVSDEGDGSTVLIDIAKAQDTLARQPNNNLILEVDPAQAAYLMYTSGSTGKPKGVLLPHQAIVHLVCDTDYTEFKHSSRGLLQAALGFDASTLEIYSMILNGGFLHIAPPGLVSLETLEQVIASNNLNSIVLSTAIFHTAAVECPKIFENVEQIFIGGDVLSPSHVNKVLDHCPGVAIYNCYGPTENAVITTTNRLTEKLPENKALSIGKPIYGTQVYVLDAANQMVPKGLPGELCTSGRGLALGYLNKDDQTSKVFIDHPLAQSSGAKLYRTGDKVRWLDDGSLEFLGRIDTQVKIRGFRIELGEIENTILQHTLVKEAAAIVRDDVTGEKSLVAYLVPENVVNTDGDAYLDDVKSFLVGNLPAHMVPNFFVVMKQLPYTTNGKLDRKALPLPQRASKAYQAPINESEKKIAAVWESLLSIEKVGRNENLFEIGASSIMMVQAHRRIQVFAPNLQVVDLFQYPTVHMLARFIDNDGEQGKAQLDAAQQRAKKRAGSNTRRARQNRRTR